MTGFNDMKGQSVILIAPDFFGYDRDIEQELINRGANVTKAFDRPFQSAFAKALTRFSRKLVMPLAERYYRKRLSFELNVHHSTGIVISGQTVSENTINHIRKNNPGIRLILYMWDSVKNRPAATAMFPLYDSVFTFDHQDAHDYGLMFRPTFYGPGLESEDNSSSDISFSFIGTAHTDRFEVFRGIRDSVPDAEKSFSFMYLQAPWVFFVEKILNPAFKHAKYNDFLFSPLSRSELFSIIKRSKVIVDIEHPKQKGLTMRPLDAIGAGKKLITTNADIRQYDIYDPDNILIIDRNDPKIPHAFFQSPPVAVDAALRHKYSIAGWLDDILRKPAD